MEVPEQTWVDGYNMEKDILRQFFAAPLGQDTKLKKKV